jgi:hypothetical protein
MARRIGIVLMALIARVSFLYIARAQMGGKTWEKTVTLPNGEVILDMSGEWDSLMEFYGRMIVIPPVSDILAITQEGKGTTFIGVKQIGSQWTPKGSESIKGELNKDGFKSVYAYIGDIDESFGWAPCKWEISENGNKVVLDCGERVEVTLTRR